MRPAPAVLPLSPNDRVRELAALLATALLRLRDRHALAAAPPPPVPTPKSAEVRPESP